MRRRASVFHLGRTNIDSLVRRLRIQDVSTWPPHLQQAFALLTEKLGSEPPVARDVVISATRAALACAAEISNLALQKERQLNRDQCDRYFRMLANNLRLLPANLKKATTTRRLGTSGFDAEVLEEVLERIVLQLGALPTNPAAMRALKASGHQPSFWIPPRPSSRLLLQHHRHFSDIL